MALTNKEKMVAIISNGIAVFSLLQERGDLPENTTMYDFVLKVIPEDIKSELSIELIDEVFQYVSTLLKLMNGMMISSKGTTKIDYVVPNMNDKKFKKMMHTIGYIPQSLGLIKNITVLENILIGALPRLSKIQSLLKKFPEHEIQEAKRILKQVALSGKENRKVYMLSGGEKRRVAIARALMQKPTILLADEIVSELDYVTAHEIMDLIADAQKRMNLTAIMVHHDMQLALEYANRVAVIKEGKKILEIGVEGETIVDFQTGDMSAEEIMEMYADNS